MNDGLDENYKELGVAVVKQACLDYVAALKMLKHHPNNGSAQAEAAHCERFFQSDWFDVLCDLDGPGLMEALQDKVEKESRR